MGRAVIDVPQGFGSSRVIALPQADGLVIVQPEQGAIKAGTVLDLVPI